MELCPALISVAPAATEYSPAFPAGSMPDLRGQLITCGTGSRSPVPTKSLMSSVPSLSHLDRLEAESIHILREVAAEFLNPVLLYSVGKDS